MLINISYNDKPIEKKIDSIIGSPYSLMDRIKKNGIGSPRFKINKSSDNINNLLVLDKNINYCNIELRPKGIIVRFRSLLETYGLIIPFYKLNIHKEKSYQYSIFYESSFIKLDVRKDKEYLFFKKMMDEKASSSLRNPF
ncbi:MAG: hypothetical protein CBC76_04885 [Flavobacteriaceae bacterium TMED116]|nr:MAG: hypothetical protein CBC76_04885 [Flavobacteriaceae bacterium TMED116]|tara:strand:- start:1950 stop:2369 length:420 start_codon:yes stop_codon:yes gene_type:complete